ncbi:MAG: hypothetical protein ACRDGD_04180 [Candidatus Limnocylindria bacterium]
MIGTDVFEAFNVASVVLAVIVGIGFLRLLWPRDRSQVAGTVIVILGIVVIIVLSALMNSTAI